MTASIQGFPVSPTPPTAGQVLALTGGVWTPATPNPGDITAVNTTLPLTGGATGGAVNLDINAFTGDSGAGGLEGTVPAPAAGDAAAGKFLAAGGGWAAPGGGGVSVLSYQVDPTWIFLNDNLEADILSSGPLAVSASKTHLVTADFEVTFSNLTPTDKVFARLYVDATKVAGRSIRVNAAAPDFAVPVYIHAIVTGLSAGNHTFKLTLQKANGDPGTVFTSTYNDADTATRLTVVEF